MTPETIAEIAALPEMNEYAAKLIFIRNSGEKSYFDDKIAECTKETLKEIIELGTVAGMSKEQIGIHLANLERARNYLSALIQGLKIAHAKEVEPAIKEKRAKEKRERTLLKVRGLSKLGINMDVLSASLSALVKEKQLTNTVNPTPVIAKVICPSCGRETYSLKLHKC
jgi:hypothetical protein